MNANGRVNKLGKPPIIQVKISPRILFLKVKMIDFGWNVFQLLLLFQNWFKLWFRPRANNWWKRWFWRLRRLLVLCYNLSICRQVRVHFASKCLSFTFYTAFVHIWTISWPFYPICNCFSSFHFWIVITGLRSKSLFFKLSCMKSLINLIISSCMKIWFLFYQ